MAFTVDPNAVASQMSGANGINGNGLPRAAENASAQGTELKKEFNQALEKFAQNPQAVNKGDIKGAQVASMVNPGLPSSTLKFSSHALERMRSRGISFSPDMMKSIEGAVGKAAAKGSKDTLVLTGDSALIVSVKNGTVVTVMDKGAMKENVFTNIDSTVMV
jgi:flagellar operon protein